MVFCCLEGGLSRVHTMIVWLDELDVDLFFFDEVFNGLRSFVVHDEEVRRQVSLS